MSTVVFHQYSDEQIPKEVASLWWKWDSRREKAKKSWNETERYVYATDTTSLIGLGQYDHTTHIPVVHQVRENLVSILYETVVPHEDWLGWKPYDKQAANLKKRDKVLAFIKNRHALNGFTKVIRKVITDLVDYGNCFCQVTYKASSEGYNGPVINRISPYDIVFDPTVSEFSKAPKIVREVISIGEFFTRSQDTELWDKGIVNAVLGNRSGNQKGFMESQYRDPQFTPAGFGSRQEYFESGFIELLWFYGDVWDRDKNEYKADRCIVVVDRCQKLADFEEKEPNIFKSGWKQRPDNSWCQGPLEQIIGLNFQINHRENSKSDVLDRAINPDKLYVGPVEEIYNDQTGQVKYLAAEGGTVQDLTPDMTVLTADMHQDRLLAFASEAVGLPPQIMGFRTPGEKTLGEVQQLDSSAFRKFILKAAIFEEELLEPAVSAELQLSVKNYTSVIQAMQQNKEGLMTFFEVTEDDLRSNGVLVPYGSRRFSRQLQQLTTLQQLGNSNLAQLIASHINTYNLAQSVERLGGFEQFEIIKKFAALEEQAEAQSLQASLEQGMVDELSQPSIQEMTLEAASGTQNS